MRRDGALCLVVPGADDPVVAPGLPESGPDAPGHREAAGQLRIGGSCRRALRGHGAPFPGGDRHLPCRTGGFLQKARRILDDAVFQGSPVGEKRRILPDRRCVRRELPRIGERIPER